MKTMTTTLLLTAAVLVLQVAFFSVPAAAEGTVLFQETFENLAVGAKPTSAEVGSWIISSYAPSQAEVVENIGNSTGKCLMVRRALFGANPSLVGYCLAGEGTYEAGTTMTIKWDYYMTAGPEDQAEWYSTAGFTMNPSTGGGGFEAGWNLRRFAPLNHRYVLPTGPNWSYSYIDTGVAMEYSKWVSFEIDMYFDPNNPTVLGGTYDMYVTPEDGVKTVLVEDVPLREINPAGRARFQVWPDAPEDQEWGGDVVNYWDNFSVVKATTALCGDMYHNYPPGDINRDCYVDMIDLAQMAAQWLDCTDVTCPGDG